MKYIDPDGHDYFRPDWGQGRDRTWNIGWGALRYLLWEFETLCKLLTAYHNFGMEHGYALDALEAGGLTAVSLFFGKILAGSSWSGPLAALFTFIVALGMIILDMVAEDVAFYWNDQKFVDLWDTAVDYVDELMEGNDCTQEAKDAWCELTVYVLQITYDEDEWRNHAPQWLLDYYDEMMERKNEGGDSENYINGTPVPI